MSLHGLRSALEEEQNEKKPVNPFEATIREITGRNGGLVQLRHLEKLLKLMEGASTTQKRLVLLTVSDSADCIAI